MDTPDKLEKDTKWVELYKRFSALAKITGREKCSSYCMTVSFSLDNNGEKHNIYIELGGYDIPGWSRHQRVGTFTEESKALEALEKSISEAEDLVKNRKKYDDEDEDLGVI